MEQGLRPKVRNLSVSLVVPQPGIGAAALAHPSHELVCFLEGAYAVEVAGRRIEAEPGTVLFYAKGTPHRPRVREDLTSRLIVLQWEGPLPWPDWGAFFTVRDRIARVSSLLHRMLDFRREEGRHRASALAALARLVICEVDALREGAVEAAPDAVRKALAILGSAPEWDFSLRELAALVQVSPWHLTRLFTREVGVPPMRYHRRLRLECAVNLVRTTRLTMDGIAARVNLASGAYLAKLIRREFGRPPGAFRGRGLESSRRRAGMIRPQEPQEHK